MAHLPVVIYSTRFRRPGCPQRSTDWSAEVTLVSAASERLLGCLPDELVGDYQRWLERVHPDDREVVRAAVVQVGRQDQPVTCEYRLADCGSENSAVPRDRWLRDTLVPHVDADGQLLGWGGLLTDITEQRVLADDLRRTTNMLHALIGNLPAGVFFVQGPLGQPILVNARARQLFGQHEDRSAGLEHLAEVYRLHRPDGTPYPTEELPVFLALRKGLTSMREDIVVHRPDGRRTPLVSWAAPVMLGPGDTSTPADAAVWVLQDLTSLHQAEAARRDTEGTLRTVLETMAEGLLVHDHTGRIIDCNTTAGVILGHLPQRLRGMSLNERDWILLREDRTPLPLEEYPNALVLRLGRPVRNRVVGIYHPNPKNDLRAVKTEEVRWVLVNAMPLGGGRTHEKRTPAGVVMTFVDITAFLNRERQLEQDLLRAQRMELVGRLSSGIAHDFNNLLTIVLSLTELIGSGLPIDHEVHADLLRIREATGQAASLAHQLLAFGKQHRVAAQSIEVNEVVRRTLDLLRASLPSRIELNTDLAARHLFIQADETQVQQVLMNLCLNARDAMPEGGPLHVQTEYVAGAVDEVRLSVRDRGTGISERAKAHLFEPFFSTKERGSGLGLAVVKQIVEGHGGRVEVFSEPGQGARFEVWWPACASEDG